MPAPGIVASGTATVEAAMMNTPFVMVYRVSALTYMMGKPRVKVPRFAMVNLIAEEDVVPELVQHDFTAEKVVTGLKEILPDGAPRTRMLEGLARVKARLRAPQAGRGSAAPGRPCRRNHPRIAYSETVDAVELGEVCHSDELARRICRSGPENSRFLAPLEMTSLSM